MVFRKLKEIRQAKFHNTPSKQQKLIILNQTTILRDKRPILRRIRPQIQINCKNSKNEASIQIRSYLWKMNQFLTRRKILIYNKVKCPNLNFNSLLVQVTFTRQLQIEMQLHLLTNHKCIQTWKLLKTSADFNPWNNLSTIRPKTRFRPKNRDNS